MRPSPPAIVILVVAVAPQRSSCPVGPPADPQGTRGPHPPCPSCRRSPRKVRALHTSQGTPGPGHSKPRGWPRRRPRGLRPLARHPPPTLESPLCLFRLGKVVSHLTSSRSQPGKPPQTRKTSFRRGIPPMIRREESCSRRLATGICVRFLRPPCPHRSDTLPGTLRSDPSLSLRKFLGVGLNLTRWSQPSRFSSLGACREVARQE